MKKNRSFWQSLEQYGWRVIRRTPLPRYWQWVGAGLVGVVFVTSWANMNNSLARVESPEEAIRKAARMGDYATARALWNNQSSINNNQVVLGAESELEELVYPAQKLAREIVLWEEALVKYPGNREIMRGLADLYEQAGEREKTASLREQVRILDPNE